MKCLSVTLVEDLEVLEDLEGLECLDTTDDAGVPEQDIEWDIERDN